MNLMGRDILPRLGIILQQKQGTTIHNISGIETRSIIMWIFKYPHLCTRIGRSKNHIAKSLFRENHNHNQQKGKVPLHLLDKAENELDKLINDKQIIQLEKRPDEVLISPVVITVRRDKSVKLALNSKKLDKAIYKKYQM